MQDSNAPLVTTIDNGITIMYWQRSHIRTFSMAIASRVGSRHEPKGLFGATHLGEHVMFRGSRRFQSEWHVNQAISAFGDSYNAMTGFEQVCAYGRCASIDWAPSAKLLCDIFLRPTMKDSSIEAERKIVLQEILQYEGSPDSYSADKAFSSFWKNQGLSHPITGDSKSVNALDPELVRNWWYDSVICGKNIIIAACGPVAPSEFVKLIEKETVDVAPKAKMPTRKSSLRCGHRIDEKADLEQMYIHLAYPGPTPRYENLEAFTLATSILGAGTNSVLFKNVREKLKACYDIQSHHYMMQHEGALVISTIHDPSKPGLNTILDVVANFSKKVTKKQFDSAKRGAIRRAMIDSENIGGSIFYNISQTIHGLELRTLEQEIAAIESVTLDQVVEEIVKWTSESPCVYRFGPIDKCCETNMGILKMPIPTNNKVVKRP